MALTGIGTGKAKMLKYIIDNEGATRKEVNLRVLGCTKPNSYSTTYQDLRHDGYIEVAEIRGRAEGYKATHSGLSAYYRFKEPQDQFLQKTRDAMLKKIRKSIGETHKMIVSFVEGRIESEKCDLHRAFAQRDFQGDLVDLILLDVIRCDKGLYSVNSDSPILNEIKG